MVAADADHSLQDDIDQSRARETLKYILHFSVEYLRELDALLSFFLSSFLELGTDQDRIRYRIRFEFERYVCFSKVVVKGFSCETLMIRSTKNRRGWLVCSLLHAAEWT